MKVIFLPVTVPFSIGKDGLIQYLDFFHNAYETIGQYSYNSFHLKFRKNG